MANKENVKVEDVILEDVELGGEESMKKKINWKLLAKCTAGVVIVGAASVALWKWRKSKKATTAVVVTTPCEQPNDNTTNEAVGSTVVEI